MRLQEPAQGPPHPAVLVSNGTQGTHMRKKSQVQSEMGGDGCELIRQAYQTSMLAGLAK